MELEPQGRRECEVVVIGACRVYGEEGRGARERRVEEGMGEGGDKG